MTNFGAFANKDRTEFSLMMKNSETGVSLMTKITWQEMIELYKNFGDVLLGIDKPFNYDEMMDE